MKSLILSHLNYANSFLYGLPDDFLGRLESVQRAAVRMIYKAGKYESISEKMKQLRLLLKLLVRTFRCLNRTAPAYLSRFVSRYQPTRDLRSAALGKSTIPLTRLEYCGRSLVSAALTLWNDLSSAIRCTSDIKTFKTELKKHLYTIAYPPGQKN